MTNLVPFEIIASSTDEHFVIIILFLTLVYIIIILYVDRYTINILTRNACAIQTILDTNFKTSMKYNKEGFHYNNNII